MYIHQDKSDFAKCVRDDIDMPAWECLHFARELVCIAERREARTAWAHWVNEGFEATRSKKADTARLNKAVSELTRIAKNERDK